MPQNQFQRMMFALLTVIITVHAYVFYSLYVINGGTFMALTGETSVIKAINVMGGVSMFGHSLPIWAIVLIEFCLAYFTQLFFIQPLVRTLFKLLFVRSKGSKESAEPISAA